MNVFDVVNDEKLLILLTQQKGEHLTREQMLDRLDELVKTGQPRQNKPIPF